MPEIFSFISNNLLTIHETLLKKILKLYRNVNRNKRTIIVMNNYHYFYQVWNLQKKKKTSVKKKWTSRDRGTIEKEESVAREGRGEIWRRIKRYGSSGLPVSRSCRCLPLNRWTSWGTASPTDSQNYFPFFLGEVVTSAVNREPRYPAGSSRVKRISLSVHTELLCSFPRAQRDRSTHVKTSPPPFLPIFIRLCLLPSFPPDFSRLPRA